MLATTAATGRCPRQYPDQQLGREFMDSVSDVAIWKLGWTHYVQASRQSKASRESNASGILLGSCGIDRRTGLQNLSRHKLGGCE